jgi:DNA-binding NarL/FixJ family response regulator
MSYYAKASEIFKKYDWKISSSILEHNMGDIWAYEGNDAKAVECYNTAISYAQEADDSLWMASPKLGLGALFMRQGKVTKALKYLHEADEYYSKHQDQEYYDRIATLDIMGQAYQTQKRQRSMLATAFAVLALVLLSLLIITRRALRLKRENVAADEAIGEALTQLEMTDSLFRLKMDQNVQLSRGEQEILPMIAEGLTSKDIAKRLFVTEQTIKWRRQRLLAKFDARNTAEMLSKAHEIGLL